MLSAAMASSTAVRPRLQRSASVGVTVEVSDRQKDDLLRRGTRGTPYGPLHAKKIDHGARTSSRAGCSA